MDNQMNTAVMVEPRFFEDMPALITDYYKKLGKGWKIVVYCGLGLGDKLASLLDNEEIEFRELTVNNFTSNEYNDFLKSRKFWEDLDGEYVLVFQMDAIIRNEEPYTIDYFMSLNKSYIGGNMNYIWRELIRDNEDTPIKNYNGGLSLRKREDMIKIIDLFGVLPTCRNSKKMRTDAEDVYFTLGCLKLNWETGNDKESSYFCVHTIFYNQFFGCHGPNNNLKAFIINAYPEAKNNKHLFKN